MAPHDLRATLAAQCRLLLDDGHAGLPMRLARRDWLVAMVSRHEAETVETQSADFGARSHRAACLSNVIDGVNAIRRNREQRATWMRPEPLPLAPAQQAAGARGAVSPPGGLVCVSPHTVYTDDSRVLQRFVQPGSLALKEHSMNRFTRRVALLLAAWLFPVALMAQTYPSQLVKIVLPSPPGGGTDTVTRIVTEPLGRLLGQPIVMDYKPGGNSIIGTQAVTGAKPDGYTLLATLDYTATILPAVYSRLPFDPAKDLQPVAMLASVPALFVAHPKVPASNLKELIDYSKANPGKLNYGSAVLYGQLLGEQLKSVSGMSYTYVPFKGAAEAVQALLGGHVDFLMLDIATGLTYIRDGRMKALTITAPKRHPSLPAVATVAEMGYPMIEMSVWYGLFAPAGTPQSAIDRLNAGVAEVIKDPALQKRLADLGHETSAMSPAQIAELIRKDTVKWAKAAKDGNVKLD